MERIKKGAVLPLPVKAPSARLEHATYCSASKRSNPLSYEGTHVLHVLAGEDFNSESETGQANVRFFYNFLRVSSTYGFLAISRPAIPAEFAHESQGQKRPLIVAGK